MPARKCLKCGDSYPYTKPGPVECPVCGEKLQYSSHSTPDTDWPLEVAEVLPTLTEEEESEWSADWCALEAEVARRGANWTVADIFGEGVRRAS